jgi:hypothetical protein
MPIVDLTKAECELLRVSMEEALAQAEAELTMHPDSDDVLENMVIRGVFIGIREKMERALKEG